MQSYFSSEFFANNRAKLRASVEKDIVIVVTANGVMQRGGDEPSAFHQDSNFWYLTGLNGADLTLVVDRDETFIIVPGLSAVREAFDGAHDLDAYKKRSAVLEFLPEREGWQQVRSRLREAKSVATLGTPAPHLKDYGIYTLPFRRNLIAHLKRISPGIEIRDLRQNLTTLRSIKQPEELAAIRRAIDITCTTLQDIAAGPLKDVAYEYEIEAAVTYGFRKRGAADHSFAPVVGAGTHSTTLHYLDNNGPVRADDLIVVDIGAEVEHYAADIARTVSRKPISGRKAAVFTAVAAAQDYALGLVKPGVMPIDYEKAVEAFIGKQLHSLGVIEKVSRENIRQYFPHATSHFLGLDTHDVGNYRAPWEAGMVITCEPGIYLPREDIGVRIEDDILITENGCEVLSKACPRALTPVQ
jgi:Xaa-Pro aminopeptidase